MDNHRTNLRTDSELEGMDLNALYLGMVTRWEAVRAYVGGGEDAMITTAQTVIGGSIGGVFLSVAVGLFIPDPKPIEVHSLFFNGEKMLQDRTVTTDGEVFFARWEAKIVDAYSGDVIPGCKGGEPWNYTAGHKVADMTLEEWVGSEACTYESLEPGAYKGIASWYWGTDQTSASSNIFVKE